MPNAESILKIYIGIINIVLPTRRTTGQILICAFLNFNKKSLGKKYVPKLRFSNYYL